MPNHPKSDHFDGKRFFNPTNPQGNGFLKAMKMLVTMRSQQWPKRVENSPALDLSHPLADNEVAVTFVNHATFLIQTQDFNLLTDPVWSERASPFTWIGPKRHRPPGIPFAQLPKIDFVLLSHNHYDHLDVATLQRLHQTFHPRFFVPLGNQQFLAGKGIHDVVELDWWQSVDVDPNLKLDFAPAEHFSARTPFDRNKTLWGSYLLSFNGHSIYFGADTAYAPHFQTIRERFGTPDLAFLPIGAYEPRWFMKVVHMNPAEAVQAHLDLGGPPSIGIHFGTFQLTSERIDQPLIDLALALKEKQIPEHQFITLAEGRTRIFRL